MNHKNLPFSYIEISKKNLIHNIKQFRDFVGKNTKIVSVIKANAYGHGQTEISSILEPYTDFFMVNSISELELLRKKNKKKCFVFGYISENDLRNAINLGCILSVFSIDHLKKINKKAKELKKIQEVHLSIDAYLGREGLLFEELPDFFLEIKKCKNIKLTGIYTHFANIEDTKDFSHAQKQIDIYENAKKIAEKHGFKNLYTHISATSGVLVYEKNKEINSLVRIGLGLYGLWPSKHLESLYKNSKFKLLPVLSWKTKIAQIKVLPKGSTIGYGLTYKTKIDTKIAVIPQGYSDGYDRRFSNKGEVLICGTRCKVLGRVAMNMFVVDVNHLKNVSVESEVVILGKQGKEEITAEEMAGENSINYEVVARINPLLPRIIV